MNKFLFIFFIPLTVFANPNWFFKIPNDEKFMIIGYGMDKSLNSAKQAAMMDITNTISVSVNSSVDISNADVNGEVSSNSSINLQTKSQAVLSGVKYIKTEYLNDIWYTAAMYDNSPLEIKLKKLLPSNIKDESQNKYLKYTQLVKDLNEDIGKKLSYDLVRKDNLWQLQYRDVLIPLSKENFYKLFSTYSTKDLSLIPNKKIYTENDEMYFDIKHKKTGYISILYVENNGKVGVLLSNHKSKKSFTYPETKSEELFKVVNPYNEAIRELYIAVYSKKPINLHKFENISENLLDETNYNFDKLISRLDSLEFSTYEIKIKK